MVNKLSYNKADKESMNVHIPRKPISPSHTPGGYNNFCNYYFTYCLIQRKKEVVAMGRRGRCQWRVVSNSLLILINKSNQVVSVTASTHSVRLTKTKTSQDLLW